MAEAEFGTVGEIVGVDADAAAEIARFDIGGHIVAAHARAAQREGRAPERIDTEQWVPPGSEVDQASLSAGTGAGWNGNAQPGEGVFLGVLPGESLPTTVPQHPECEAPRPAVTDRRDGDSYVTVTFPGCEHGGVTIERVVQVTTNRLLWVQVRAEDVATANDVLDSVEPGL